MLKGFRFRIPPGLDPALRPFWDRLPAVFQHQQFRAGTDIPVKRFAGLFGPSLQDPLISPVAHIPHQVGNDRIFINPPPSP